MQDQDDNSAQLTAGLKRYEQYNKSIQKMSKEMGQQLSGDWIAIGTAASETMALMRLDFQTTSEQMITGTASIKEAFAGIEMPSGVEQSTQGVIGALSEFGKRLAEAVIAIGGLSTGIETVGDIFDTLKSGLGTFGTKLGEMSAAGSKSMEALGTASGKAFTGLQTQMANVGPKLANLGKSVSGGLVGAFRGFGTTLSGLASGGMGVMTTAIGAMGTALKSGLMGALRLAGIAFAALTSPIGIAVAAIVGIGVLMYTFRDQIADALKPVGQFFYNYIFKPLDQVVSFVVKKMASMLSWVVDKVSGAAKFFGKDELAAGLDSFSEKLDDFSKKKAPLLETTAVKVADGMRNAGKGAAEMMDVLAKKASDTLGGVKDDMDGVTEGAGEADTAIANTAAKAEESGLGDCKPCDGETGIEEAGAGDTAVGEAVSDKVMPEAPAMEVTDPNADPNAEGGDGEKLGEDGKPLLPEEETEAKRRSVIDQLKLDKDKWKGLLGNTEKGAKAIRAVESAEAVKSIITSTAKSIGKAMELGFPAAIPAAAAAAASGAKQLATIKGQFHDGIDSVPRTGSYLLEGGERVLDRRLNSDLKDYLSRGANTHNNSVNVDMHFDASMDPDTAYRNQEKLKEAMEDLFREHVLPSPFGHYR